MQLQHAGVDVSLWWQQEWGCTDSLDAKGQQALLVIVFWLGLFCMAVSWVSDHAHVVGCTQQAFNIVQVYWQKVQVFMAWLGKYNSGTSDFGLGPHNNQTD